MDTSDLLSIIGICFIVSTFIFGSKSIGISVLFPVIGAALLILFCTSNNSIGRILSTKVFVFIGKISYSLYLWHWIIIVLFKNLHYQLQLINQHVLNGFIIVFTFLLSYLSYNLIENKTRNHKHTPIIVLFGVVLISGLTIYFHFNFYSSIYKSKYNKQISYVEYYDISPTQKTLKNFLDKNNLFQNILIPKRKQKCNDAYKKEGIIGNEKKGTPKIMLIGDSHGVMWAKLLNEISEDINVSISCYTANGCNPFFNLENINSQSKNELYTKTQRIDYAKSIIKNIEKWKPKLIVLSCCWISQNEETTKYFNELLLYLKKNNIKILLLTQPPVLNFMENKNADQYFTYLKICPKKGYNLIDVVNSNVLTNNNCLKNLVSKYNNVSIYDVYENMVYKNKVKITFNKEVLYFDDDHLSYFGTFIHKKNISKLIDNILNYRN